LALGIGQHDSEVWQENGSGKKHPHHPTLHKNSEDDARHTHDLRYEVFGHAIATFFIG
jgi:hypothetical protein